MCVRCIVCIYVYRVVYLCNQICLDYSYIATRLTAYGLIKQKPLDVNMYTRHLQIQHCTTYTMLSPYTTHIPRTPYTCIHTIYICHTPVYTSQTNIYIRVQTIYVRHTPAHGRKANIYNCIRTIDQHIQLHTVY